VAIKVRAIWSVRKQAALLLRVICGERREGECRRERFDLQKPHDLGKLMKKYG
jgi:hypothetical protein